MAAPRPGPAVRAANPADREQAVATLAAAFADDPAMSSLFPDAALRRARLPRFFDLMWRSGPDINLTDLADDGDAVAIWRAPDGWDIPTVRLLRFAVPLLRTFGLALPRALALQGLLEAHHPRAPHWYLAFVGCHPSRQGRGLGGAAIRARLARCDAEAMPAALETATESNLAIYRALGFEVSGSFDVPKGPRFWTMWREPHG